MYNPWHASFGRRWEPPSVSRGIVASSPLAPIGDHLGFVPVLVRHLCALLQWRTRVSGFQEASHDAAGAAGLKQRREENLCSDVCAEGEGERQWLPCGLCVTQVLGAPPAKCNYKDARGTCDWKCFACQLPGHTRMRIQGWPSLPAFSDRAAGGEELATLPTCLLGVGTTQTRPRPSNRGFLSTPDHGETAGLI
jgi:hypothetical protein